MKELVVISGKGGTGKTSITAAFAALTDNAVLCDADVDAADLHLLMAPEILSRQDFLGGGEAVIRPELCTQCGLCRELCRFNAVRPDFRIDPIACEGCGVCVDLCPVKAIDFPTKTCGQWYISKTRFGSMVHARLGIAEENSGKLVTLVRKEARRVAEDDQRGLILTDGPPGVGCPVIASIGGATAILIVTEPTLSGLHDMERVADLAAHFKVPGMVCVNKFDLNPEQTRRIETLTIKKNMTFLGRIPFDAVFTKAMIQGKTLVEFQPSSVAAASIAEIWEGVKRTLGNHQ
ncbi:MAG: ATP-binding protein [Thermodesulfobacteriota bacterium]